MEAATMDERFEKITVAEKDDIKIRIDVINTRKIIDEATLRKLDPVKNGVIVIKRDYKKLAVILPNISPNLITGSDTIEILGRKLG
jgi:AMMECR1 domain-containing protein